MWYMCLCVGTVCGVCVWHEVGVRVRCVHDVCVYVCLCDTNLSQIQNVVDDHKQLFATHLANSDHILLFPGQRRLGEQSERAHDAREGSSNF